MMTRRIGTRLVGNKFILQSARDVIRLSPRIRLVCYVRSFSLVVKVVVVVKHCIIQLVHHAT